MLHGTEWGSYKKGKKGRKERKGKEKKRTKYSCCENESIQIEKIKMDDWQQIKDRVHDYEVINPAIFGSFKI